MSQLCEFKIVDSFDLIISYLNEDVISKDEPNALKSHFANHLMDMSTYREVDLCASSNFKEKLFVSTVHKAKGLEFENVVVMRAVNERYPHFAHRKLEQQEEDKRLFYVAISRAMKRLIVSGSSRKGFTPYLESIIDKFTIRYNFYNRYLIEIGSDEMRITDKGKLIRQYKNLSKVYSPSNIRDQRALQDLLRYRSNSLELPEISDRLLSKYGVFPS